MGLVDWAGKQVARLLFVLVWLSIWGPALGFREGEFITSARKSQYQEMRSQWHDLLGTHCPRFGMDRMVALPIPKPHVPLVHGKDQYKIQLSFDGDRHLTPWLKIMGTGAPAVPVVHIELRRAGDELLGLSAKVVPAPVAYQHMHSQLVEEFKNASHWPKHLLIQYRFKAEHEVDLDRGLYLLMAMGLLLLSIIVVNAASGSQSKLAKFLMEMTSEDPAAAGAAGSSGTAAAAPLAWKGQGKGE